MKAIVLHTAALTNAGMYVDAGATVAVGADEDQIAEDRADALVTASKAVVAPSDKAIRSAPSNRSIG